MRQLFTIILALMLASCATTKTPQAKQEEAPKQAKNLSPATVSELAYGKKLFQDGYFKRAMQQLLPLAAEGNMEAEYAVGYMYYYGYGVAQDTETGDFWIKRSADQQFEPAVKALSIMHANQKTQRERLRT